MSNAEIPRLSPDTKIRIQEGRKNLRDKIPALAVQIFAIGNRTQVSWEKMKSLGFLIHNIYNYDAHFELDTLICCEICYEELFEYVEETENSLDAAMLPESRFGSGRL
jgi:hypothetical protein